MAAASRRCLTVGSTPDSGETPLPLCEPPSEWGKLPLSAQATQHQSLRSLLQAPGRPPARPPHGNVSSAWGKRAGSVRVDARYCRLLPRENIHRAY